MIDNQVKIFNITINNLYMVEALEYITNFISGNQRGYVVTPNVDHIVMLNHDKLFKKTYESAELVLADGMPIVWVSRLVGKPLKERVSGADLFLHLLSLAEQMGFRIFLLGSSEQVSTNGVSKMNKEFPMLEIAGRYSPPLDFEKDQVENDKIIRMINSTQPHILFVFLGAPKQEKWIYSNISSLSMNMAFCVGASLDFYSEKIKRAPKLFQKLGLEWFWRLLYDPKRLVKRYLIDDLFPFIYLTLREVITR